MVVGKLRKLLRVFDWERERTNRGSIVAKAVRLEVERLLQVKGLSDFKINPVGTAAEDGFIEGLDHPDSPDLDYEVLFKGERIAEFDVTDSNWTFQSSGCMPVRDYKGLKVQKLGVPTFFIFRMNKEPNHLKDQCVWIKGEDVLKSDFREGFMGGKNVKNYFTNKADWYRGLNCFIEELESLTGCTLNKKPKSNQTTLC